VSISRIHLRTILLRLLLFAASSLFAAVSTSAYPSVSLLPLLGEGILARRVLHAHRPQQLALPQVGPPVDELKVRENETLFIVALLIHV